MNEIQWFNDTVFWKHISLLILVTNKWLSYYFGNIIITNWVYHLKFFSKRTWFVKAVWSLLPKLVWLTQVYCYWNIYSMHFIYFHTGMFRFIPRLTMNTFFLRSVDINNPSSSVCNDYPSQIKLGYFFPVTDLFNQNLFLTY